MTLGELMANKDLQHAAIGSALGSIIMGGSRYFSDRKKDRGDVLRAALTGAVGGGVAGVAIPRGLEMLGGSGVSEDSPTPSKIDAVVKGIKDSPVGDAIPSRGTVGKSLAYAGGGALAADAVRAFQDAKSTNKARDRKPGIWKRLRNTAKILVDPRNENTNRFYHPASTTGKGRISAGFDDVSNFKPGMRGKRLVRGGIAGLLLQLALSGFGGDAPSDKK